MIVALILSLNNVQKMFNDQRFVRNLCEDESCFRLGLMITLVYLVLLFLLYCMQRTNRDSNKSESPVQLYEDKPPSYDSLFKNNGLTCEDKV